MHPIADPGELYRGAVVYNPALGFAMVEHVGQDGFSLKWENPGERLPKAVSKEAACNGYRFCDPDGFFALSVLDPEDLRRRFQQETVEMVSLLLQELREPQSPTALKEWITGRGLLDNGRFDKWWRDLQLDQKPGFSYHKGQISLAAGIVTIEDEVDVRAPGSGRTLWSDLAPLEGQEIFYAGAEMLGLLARVHTGGRAAGLLSGKLYQDKEGGLLLEEGRGGGDPSVDLLAAGRLLLTRILGRSLPRHPPPHKLLAYLPGLAPAAPASAMALLEPLLAPDRNLRPRDAIEVYPKWLAAAAHEEVRAEGEVRKEASWEFGSDSHIGFGKMQLGQTNQDALAIARRDDATMLLVADGISQSDTGTGDEASMLTSQVMGTLWRELAHAPRGQAQARSFLESTLAAANRAICDRSLRIAGGDITDRIPMGTTVVVALLRGEMVDLAALGDSRIYLVTPSGAGQLSPDMNYGLMRMVERDPSELPSPEDSALTHYLGHFDENGRPQLPPVWHRRLRVLPGEALVLCTDGVPDYATPLHAAFSRLLAHTVNSMSPLESARHLIATANDGGGGDNATAIVAKLRAL